MCSHLQEWMYTDEGGCRVTIYCRIKVATEPLKHLVHCSILGYTVHIPGYHEWAIPIATQACTSFNTAITILHLGHIWPQSSTPLQQAHYLHRWDALLPCMLFMLCMFPMHCYHDTSCMGETHEEHKQLHGNCMACEYNILTILGHCT